MSKVVEKKVRERKMTRREEDEVLARVRVPQIEVRVVREGSDEGGFWDAMTRVRVPAQISASVFTHNHLLADRLRGLADFFQGTRGDVDGEAEILVLRRRR